MSRRSKLITSALRRDLLEKAATCGTDVVHIELEDGIPAGQKEPAREAALKALREIDWHDCEVWVRVNTPGTEEAGRDVAMIVEGVPRALLIPKVRGPEDIQEVASQISAAEQRHGLPEGQIAIAAVIEGIVGLSNVEAIATAHPRMTALVLGTEDMSVEYGYRLDRQGQSLETLYLKSRCILAARLAGIDCIDAAHFHYRDLDGTRAAAAWSAQLGFTGKTCLTPPQVGPVNQAFEPSEEEVVWARRVLDALDQAALNDLAVAVADGMMVDAPHALQAQQILQRAVRTQPEREA